MASKLSGHDASEADPRKQLERRPSTFITPAQLNLTRVIKQDRQRQLKNNDAKSTEPSPDQAKGKPRLLLMGQRRYIANKNGVY